MSSARPLVAVVGGGISGLAAAWHLTRSERVDVVVLEAGSRTGGALVRARVGPPGGGGPVLDLGAESLLARRPEALDLARAVGLGGDLVFPATTRAAIASRGALHPMPRGTLMGVPGDPAALRGLLTEEEVRRAGAERLGAPVAEDDDVAVGTWVAQRLGPAVVDRLVEPLLGGVHAGHADDLSLRSTVPGLWTAAREGSSVLDAVVSATVSTAGTAAGSTTTGSTATGSTGQGGAGAVFAGIRGGVARLAEATAQAATAAGAGISTGVRARSLVRRGGRWQLRLELAAGGHEDLVVDGVVLAVPPAPAAALLAGVCAPAAAELAVMRTAGLALVTAVLPAGSLAALTDDDGAPLSGMLVPPVEGRLVKAMTASSRKWDWVAQAVRSPVAGPPGGGAGPEVLRLSVGRAGEEAVLAAPDADLAAAALADAGDLLGTTLVATTSTVTRWPDALPQHAVGHLARVAAIQAAIAQLPGVAVAGAAYDGVGIPACLARAAAAAGQVLDALSGAGARMGA